MKIFGIDSAIMWHDDLFLRKPSRELTKDEVLDSSFKEIVNYMFQALYEAPTGVGVAAPQIGLQIQLVVIDIKRDGKKPMVLINPSFEPIGEALVNSTETCLSFPERGGGVQRYKKVKVRAKNVLFEDIEFESDSFLGIVCQHEIDHLKGMVYVDKTVANFEPTSFYENMANKSMARIYPK